MYATNVNGYRAALELPAFAANVAALTSYDGPENHAILLSHTAANDGGGGTFTKQPARWSLGTTYEYTNNGGGFRLAPRLYRVASGGSGYTNGPATITDTTGTNISYVGITTSGGAITTITNVGYKTGNTVVYTNIGRFSTTTTNTIYNVVQSGVTNGTASVAWFDDVVRPVAGGTTSPGKTPAKLMITETVDGVPTRLVIQDGGTYSVLPGTKIDGFRQLVTCTNGPFTISSITRSGVIATATYPAGSADYQDGDYITIQGASPSQYSGRFLVHDVTATTFKYDMDSDPGSSATGTITATFADDTSTPLLDVFVRGRNGMFHESATPGYWWQRTEAGQVKSTWFGTPEFDPFATPTPTDATNYNAHLHLQAGLDAASLSMGTFWVKAGTYIVRRPLALNNWIVENGKLAIQGENELNSTLYYTGTADRGSMFQHLMNWKRTRSGLVYSLVREYATPIIKDFHIKSVYETIGEWSQHNVTNRWAIDICGFTMFHPSIPPMMAQNASDFVLENLFIEGFHGTANAFDWYGSGGGGIRVNYAYGINILRCTVARCNQSFSMGYAKQNVVAIGDWADALPFINILNMERCKSVGSINEICGASFYNCGLVKLSQFEYSTGLSPVSVGGTVVRNEGGGGIRMCDVGMGTVNAMYLEGQTATNMVPWMMVRNSHLTFDGGHLNAKGQGITAIMVAEGRDGNKIYSAPTFNNWNFRGLPNDGSVKTIATNGIAYDNTNGFATITTTNSHGFKPGDRVSIQGVYNNGSLSLYDTHFIIKEAPTSTTFKIYVWPTSITNTTITLCTNATANLPNICFQVGASRDEAYNWQFYDQLLTSTVLEDPGTPTIHNYRGLDGEKPIVKVVGPRRVGVRVVTNGDMHLLDGQGNLTKRSGFRSLILASSEIGRIGISEDYLGGRLMLSLTNATQTLTSSSTISNYPPMLRLSSGGSAITLSANPAIRTIDASKDQIMWLAYESGASGSITIPSGLGTSFDKPLVLRPGTTAAIRYDGANWTHADNPPYQLGNSALTQVTSYDDSTLWLDHNTGVGSMTNLTDWVGTGNWSWDTSSPTNWSVMTTNVAVTGNLTAAANITGPRSSRYGTATINFGSPRVLNGTNTTLSLYFGGNLIKQWTNAPAAAETVTGRFGIVDQKVYFTIAQTGTGTNNINVLNMDLQTYSVVDTMHRLDYPNTYLVPSTTAGPWFTLYASGTHAANANAKNKIIALSTTGTTNLPEVVETITTSANGGVWNLRALVYATAASAYALDAVYQDIDGTQRFTKSTTTLTNGFAWANSGIIYIGANADGADADVTINNSSVEYTR